MDCQIASRAEFIDIGHAFGGPLAEDSEILHAQITVMLHI